MRSVVRVGLSLAVGLLLIAESQAAVHRYPRVANLFTSIPGEEEIRLLSKWDLVCLSAGVQDVNPGLVDSLRSYNPDIVVIAYFPAGFIWDRWRELGETAYGYGSKVEANDWWLHDHYGNRIGEEGNLWFTNLATVCRPDGSGKILAAWLADYMANEILGSGLWDGILIDGMFENPVWINNHDRYFATPGAAIDANEDGIADSAESLYVWWRDGVETLLSELRARIGYSYVVIANGKNYMSQYLNGGIREDFPYMHGDWEANMLSDFGYLTMCRDWLSDPLNCPLLLCYYDDPENTLTEPHRTIGYERFLRFTLTSALLGDGYYFLEGRDGDALWWEDYYDFDLGNPLGDAHLDSVWSSIYHRYFKVWMREFENATIYCNPYQQWIPFEDGTWLGAQDGLIVQHSLPSSLSLAAQAIDGIRTFSQDDRAIHYSVRVVNTSESATYFSLWSRLTQTGDTVACGAPRRFLIGADDTLETSVALRFLEPPGPGLYCLEVFVGSSRLVPVTTDTLYVRRIVDFEKKIHINDDGGEGDLLSIYPQPGVSSISDIRMEVNLENPEIGACKVEMYDVRGRRVARIDQVELQDSKVLSLGALEEGKPLAPGIYFLAVTIGERQVTRKIVLLSR